MIKVENLVHAKVGAFGTHEVIVTDSKGTELLIVIHRTDFGNIADVEFFVDAQKEFKTEGGAFVKTN